MTVSKSIAIILAGLVVLFWVGFAAMGISAVADKNAADSGTNHALIIGINKYDFWPELKSPVKDSEAMARVLTEKYNFKKSNIVLLNDNAKEKPNLVNILTYLDKFATELTEKDNLLIFFFGHSKEDDQGETYWIPKNGKETSKMTWINHAAVSEEVFASDKFKAKNLCVITDSPFSAKLFRPRATTVSPFDLRYTEKVLELATRRSRELIAFGDQHWPGSKKTEDLGLFAYSIQKALLDNTLDIIDFENLIFDENIIFQISKVAGTKITRGRFRTELDQRGQFIINKVATGPVIEIVATEVSPDKGYPGDTFLIKAKTSAPASEVVIDIDGQKNRMKGSGTDWTFSAKAEKPGKTAYKIAALNEREISGKPQPGEFTIIPRRTEVANVEALTVEPQRGVEGENFKFTARTDTPADTVELIIKDKRYKMQGSGTNWSLTRAVEDTGSVDFSIAALNKDGVKGRAKEGSVTVKAAAVNVVQVDTTPREGYSGEEFTITARTSRSANTVAIQIDGQEFPMEGSGNNWRFKKTIADIGKKQFTVIAKNADGVTGQSRAGELLTKRSPLPIPNVAAVDVNIVAPGKGYAGDSFEINVKTTASSESVFVAIEGDTYQMTGSGTEWKYVAKVNKLGENKYRVGAKNKDGAQGESREGVITTTKKPLEPVNILAAQVNPPKGYAGKEFNFTASTDKPAKGVALIIGRERYEMTGSGTSWRFTQKLDITGDINFSVVARNADDAEGLVKTASLVIEEEPKGYAYIGDGKVKDRKTGQVLARFVDNGDGTITDRVTSLMWLQTPKTIAVTWDEANEFCRTLDFKGHSGWRLPTIEELRALVDTKKQNPALPPGHPFTNVLTHVGYWSKTKHKFGPQYVYQMNMWYGKDGYLKKEENSIVWPVRYAEELNKG
ncbi:MAG: DUF1566 domain-containing protein [Thermodesulfobacteriota bacterium]